MFKLTIIYKDDSPETPHMMGAVIKYWEIIPKRIWFGIDDNEENDDCYDLEDLDTIWVDGEIVWQAQT